MTIDLTPPSPEAPTDALRHETDASVPARPRRRDRGRRGPSSAGLGPRASHLLWPVGFGLLLLGGWWLVTAVELWSPVILPPPSKVWTALIQSTTTHDGQRGLEGAYLWEHLWASLWRILRGLFWGIVVGVPLGFALAAIPWFRRATEPYLSFLRSLPPLGYFSLLIIWFGIADTSKIWLLFLAAFPPIALATMSGVARVRPEYVESSRSLGASRAQVVLHTVLPASLPDIFTGVRIALGFAWTTIVAAETSNGLPGIGGLAWATKKQLRTDVAILCVIVIGITALALDMAIKAIERLVVPWRDHA